jgi:hypothetical protein
MMAGVTTTGGDLIFTGEITGDFLALDARSGNVLLRQALGGPAGGISPAPWSKDSTLAYMDDAGINEAITSISTPGVHMGDDAAARDLARRVNEISADLIKNRPDRFGGFAALPLPDVDGALRALEYGLDVLKLDGVVLFSDARGTPSVDHGPHTRCVTSAARPLRRWPWHLCAQPCSRLPPGPCRPFAHRRSAIRKSPGPLCGCHRLSRWPHCRFGVRRRC